MKEVKAFKCSYCDEIYSDKSSCRSHESKCRHNPSRRSCESCAFCAEMVYFDKILHEKKVSFCMKDKDIAIYHISECNQHKTRGADCVSDMIEAALSICDISGQIRKSLNAPF